MVSDTQVIPVSGSEGVAAGNGLTFGEQDLIEQFNQGYRCPPDAGPMWKTAHAAGTDMSLVEDALRMSPAQRLREHQRALNQILAFKEARRSPEHDSRS